jgi:hypothetical protein
MSEPGPALAAPSAKPIATQRILFIEQNLLSHAAGFKPY